MANKQINETVPQRTQADLEAKIDKVFADLAELANDPDLPIELFEAIDKFRKQVEKRAEEVALEACTAARLRYVTSLGFKRWAQSAAHYEATQA